MSLQKIAPRTTILLVMIIAVGALRVIFNFDESLSPLANFSPIGAMALFGGAYFSGRTKQFLFPLLTLFVSDVVLSLTVFSQYSSGLLYGGWYWVYGAFALMTLTGNLLIKNATAKNILLATLVCVLIHWIVTDFGVWLNSTVYPQTAEGFVACLIAAIPFELRFLTGTTVYSAILFGSFKWMEQKHPAFKKAIA